mmetsp:Transcript_73870/g.208522  ORF Transcript_73870/g.208522 Transcript_73870/m.208522 type:complete len:488 (+) Transcript_73870:163-1626(+)
MPRRSYHALSSLADSGSSSWHPEAPLFASVAVLLSSLPESPSAEKRLPRMFPRIDPSSRTQARRSRAPFTICWQARRSPIRLPASGPTCRAAMAPTTNRRPRSPHCRSCDSTGKPRSSFVGHRLCSCRVRGSAVQSGLWPHAQTTLSKVWRLPPMVTSTAGPKCDAASISPRMTASPPEASRACKSFMYIGGTLPPPLVALIMLKRSSGDLLRKSKCRPLLTRLLNHWMLTSNSRVVRGRRLTSVVPQPFRWASWAACTAVSPPPTTRTRSPASKFFSTSPSLLSTCPTASAGRDASAAGMTVGPGKPRASTTADDDICSPLSKSMTKSPSSPRMSLALASLKSWGSCFVRLSQKSRNSALLGSRHIPALTSGSSDKASLAAGHSSISSSRPCITAGECPAPGATGRRKRTGAVKDWSMPMSKTSGCATAGLRSHWIPSAAKRALQEESHGAGSTTQTRGWRRPARGGFATAVPARVACCAESWSLE